MLTLRYNYSGSYADPTRHHFGWGAWLTEEECRQYIALALRNTEYAPGSLHIVVQQKKSRWLPYRNGSVAEIFPDVWAQYQRDVAVDGIMGEGKAASFWVQGELRAAARRGYGVALQDARQLVAFLERINAVTTPSNQAPESR